MTNEFKCKSFSTTGFDGLPYATAQIEEYLNGLHKGWWGVQVCHIRECDGYIIVLAKRWRRDPVDPKKLEHMLHGNPLEDQPAPADEVPSIQYDEDEKGV